MRLIARGGCWIDNDDDDEYCCCCCCCCRCWEVAVEVVPPRTRLLPPVVEATTFFHKPLPEEVADETKEPSESNGLTGLPTMPLPLPLALVPLLLLPTPTPPPPRAANDDDGAATGAAKGSNGLILINGFDILNCGERGLYSYSIQFNSIQIQF